MKVYEAAISLGVDELTLDREPILNAKIELNLKDTMDVQTFYLEIKPQLHKKYGEEVGPCFALLGKFTIEDFYEGSKYPYTCISEMKAEETYQ